MNVHLVLGVASAISLLVFSPAGASDVISLSAGEMSTQGELEVWNKSALLSSSETRIDFAPGISASAASVLAHGFDTGLPVYELKAATVDLHGTTISGDSMLIIPALGEIMSGGELLISAAGSDKSMPPRDTYACSSQGTITINGIDTHQRTACVGMVEVYCAGAVIRTRLKHSCMEG